MIGTQISHHNIPPNPISPCPVIGCNTLPIADWLKWYCVAQFGPISFFWILFILCIVKKSPGMSTGQCLRLQE